MEKNDVSGVKFRPFPTTKFYGKKKKCRPQRSRSVSAVEETLENVRHLKIPNEFCSRILGPTVCWQTFYRQADAFDFARKMAEDVHVFAFESCADPTKPGTGQRRYLASSLPVFWHYYSQLEACRKTHYEIIPEGTPCKLYFDLEYQRDNNPECDGNEMVDILIKYVCTWLYQLYGLNCDRRSVLDLDASTSSKFSRHLIFQGADLVFENNVSQGNFIRYVFGFLKERSYSFQHTSSIENNVTYSPCTTHNHIGQGVDDEACLEPAFHFVNGLFSPKTSDQFNSKIGEHFGSKSMEQFGSKATCEAQPNHSLIVPVIPDGTKFISGVESFDNSSDDELCLYGSDTSINNDLNENNEIGAQHSSHHCQSVLNAACDNSIGRVGPYIPTSHDDDNHLGRSFSCDVDVENGVSQQESVVEKLKRDEMAKAVFALFKTEQLEKLVVKKKDGSDALLCDLGVYTKNRNFRLYQASKLNKDNHLQLAKENEFIPLCSDEANKERETFYASLVSNVSLSSGSQVLTFDLVEGSSKVVTHTRWGEKAGTVDKTCQGFVCHQDKSTLEGWGCTSPYPEIDQFISSLVSGQGKNGSIRHWNYWTQQQTLVYDIAGYRWCHNVQRHHKSNNIMYVVDIGTCVFYQKCHDPDCQVIKYRSPEMPLPRDVLPGFFIESDDFQECFGSKDVTCGEQEDDEEQSEEDALLTAVEDVEMLQSVEEII